MFLAMQPQEKCRKHQHELHFTKAFETRNKALMEAADQVRLSSLKFLAFHRQLHDEMTVRVATSVLAPILFNVFLVAVALLARQRLLPDAGVDISYRLAGILFDLSRLRVLRKESLQEMLAPTTRRIVNPKRQNGNAGPSSFLTERRKHRIGTAQQVCGNNNLVLLSR